MQRVGRSLATREIREVGQVAGLWRYPVKSMAAEALDEAERPELLPAGRVQSSGRGTGR